MKIFSEVVFIGSNGRKFETEELARRSFVREELGEMLLGDQVHYDFSCNMAADALIDNADRVIELLNAARGK